jgi:hypothetical protein
MKSFSYCSLTIIVSLLLFTSCKKEISTRTDSKFVNALNLVTFTFYVIEENN